MRKREEQNREKHGSKNLKINMEMGENTGKNREGEKFEEIREMGGVSCRRLDIISINLWEDERNGSGRNTVQKNSK